MRDTDARAVPQARTEELLIERVDDETVVYDLRTKEVHCLGPLATAVLEQCDGKTSVASIASAAGGRVGWAVSGDDVAMALAQLEERDLLSRPALKVVNGLSRREMMRKTAIVGGSVAAATLITTITAPTAAMASSHGIPTGCTGCGGAPPNNKDCASGHCCQSVRGKSCNQSCCVLGNNSCQLNETTGLCSVPLDGCGSVVCPPGTSKCCTAPVP